LNALAPRSVVFFTGAFFAPLAPKEMRSSSAWWWCSTASRAPAAAPGGAPPAGLPSLVDAACPRPAPPERALRHLRGCTAARASDWMGGHDPSHAAGPNACGGGRVRQSRA
jgi:hypothetical protein